MVSQIVYEWDIFVGTQLVGYFGGNSMQWAVTSEPHKRWVQETCQQLPFTVPVTKFATNCVMNGPFIPVFQWSEVQSYHSRK